LCLLGATVAPVSTSNPKSSNGTPDDHSEGPSSVGVTANKRAASAAAPDPSDGSFHDELRRLAEGASDPHHNPIAAAARVEECWRKQYPARHGPRSAAGARGAAASDSAATANDDDGVDDDDDDDDVMAFNIVLKAWRDCSYCLAENEVQFDAADAVVSHPTFSSSEGSSAAAPAPAVVIITPNDAANHALQLLTDRLASSGAVDTTSHNLVMDAFVKSRHRAAFDRVTAIFQMMSNDGTEDNNDRAGCSPDVVTWNNLLEGAAYAPGEDRLEVLESLWSQMQQGPCRPNTRSVNTVLHAYSRPDRGLADGPKFPTDWEGRAARCEQVFGAMSDQPDATTYTNLMTIHARRGAKAAAERAEELFRELHKRHETSAPGKDRYRPTVHSYTSVMNAWASVQDPQAPTKAEEWLDRLLNDPTVQPNTKCYNACLQAWSRSSDPTRTAKALKLLQQMKKDPSTYPNRASYLAALWACNVKNGTPLQQTAALKVAFAVFRAAEQDSLHHGLYVTLLRVVSALLPPDSAHGERDNVSTAVFQKAVKDGRVSKEVLRAFQQASSAGAFHSVLVPAMVGEHGEVLYHKIPASWSKHTR
jgi:Pentatricopeptide repeat domain